jgi:mycothiol synthase
MALLRKMPSLIFKTSAAFPAVQPQRPRAYSIAGPRIVDRVADLTTRPYEPGDAAAFTALMNAVDEAGGGRAAFTAEEIDSELSAIVAHFPTDSQLTFAPDGTLVAGGVVSTPPADGFRTDLFGGVHPDWCGQSLGRAVLGWQYERATQIHAATATGTQWQAETRVMTGEPTAARLLARLEFAPVRYFFEMLAPTTTTSGATLPAGLRSEVLPPGIDRSLYEADAEAFTDHWGFQRHEFGNWRSMMLHTEGFRPELSRVVVDGDEIAGYLLSYRDNDPSRINIGRVGTRRRWRGKGVASALMAEVIEASARAGYPYVCLGVDAASPTGAVGVYERAGFKQEHSFVAYRRPIG